MMTWHDLVSQNYCSVFLILVMVMLLYRNKVIEKRVRSAFSLLITITVVQIVLANLNTCMGAIPDSSYICACLAHVSYLLKPTLLFMILLISQRDRSKHHKLLLMIPLIVEAAVLAVSLPFGWVVSYLPPLNRFTEGPLYPTTFLILLLYMILIIVSAVRHHVVRTECSFLLLGECIITLNIINEVFFGGTEGMEQTVIVLAELIYYLFFESQSYATQRFRQERKLGEARIQAMTSQIKPHFIYNSLACIAETCHDGAPEAQEAILTFSAYLRRCFQSMEENGMTSFAEELNTIRHYIALEKMQAMDELTMIYDIRLQDFFVPVLSIETLVENAVKHGIRRKHGGGTVTLRSDREREHIVIWVEDDGVGFDPERQMSDSNHLGLANAKMRLHEQCGASMSIESKPGCGTRIKISIPEVKQK